MRDPDYESNMKKLTKIFRDKDYERMKFQNYISAIINQQRLNIALRNFEISIKLLLTDSRNNYPKLNFSLDFRLEYLFN
jgi:hypothetical protein